MGSEYELSVLRVWSSGSSKFFERFVTIVELVVPIEARRRIGTWSFVVSSKKRWASFVDRPERWCRSSSGRLSIFFWSIVKAPNDEWELETVCPTYCFQFTYMYRASNTNVKSPVRYNFSRQIFYAFNIKTSRQPHSCRFCLQNCNCIERPPQLSAMNVGRKIANIRIIASICCHNDLISYGIIHLLHYTERYKQKASNLSGLEARRGAEDRIGMCTVPLYSSIAMR